MFVASLAVSAALATAGGESGRAGSIANALHRGEKLKAAIYFAGPENPGFAGAYTRHPVSPITGPDHWKQMDKDLALVRSAGLNTLALSYWGHEGETDGWSPAWLFSRRRWDGSGKKDYTEDEQTALALRFFRLAKKHGLLIAPMIEVSPRNPFAYDFPAKPQEMERRAGWLLKRFGRESNWLSVRDSKGRAKQAIWLIETIHVGPVEPQTFCAELDALTDRLGKAAGRQTGVVIDPTPLPGYGSHKGPEPNWVDQSESILAIAPFNITSQGTGAAKPQDSVTEEDRLAYARDILTMWSRGKTPLVAPVLPGYDARHVFPEAGVYGFTPAWREAQTKLALEFGNGGFVVDCWNGWGEGYAIPPSREEGDVNLRWIKELGRRLSSRPR